MTQADPTALIRLGRACVHLIEAADVLLERKLEQQDMIDLQAAREYAKVLLREIIEDAEPTVTAEIMAVSEKMLGTVRDVGAN
jgi:hypothetical protein